MMQRQQFRCLTSPACPAIYLVTVHTTIRHVAARAAILRNPACASAIQSSGSVNGKHVVERRDNVNGALPGHNFLCTTTHMTQTLSAGRKSADMLKMMAWRRG